MFNFILEIFDEKKENIHTQTPQKRQWEQYSLRKPFNTKKKKNYFLEGNNRKRKKDAFLDLELRGLFMR